MNVLSSVVKEEGGFVLLVFMDGGLVFVVADWHGSLAVVATRLSSSTTSSYKPLAAKVVRPV